MFKKILFFSLFLGLWGCLCNDILLHWNVKDLEAKVFSQIEEDKLGSIFDGDSLFLQIILEPEFIAYQSTNFLINSAMATSCPSPGEEGLIDKIKSLEIISLHLMEILADFFF